MKIKMAKIFGILISVLVLFASCGQIADGGDVPQGYAKVRVSEPNGRAITAEEKQNSRFEYYFNDRKSESNETIAQVGSRLRIKVVAIDGRNGRQVATGEKTITVAAGMNNVDILLREDRGPYVNMVRWSAGVATVGSVENMPADESRSPGDVITVPQNPTWVYADTFNGWSYGNAQLVDENDSPISGNLTDGKKFKVPDGGVTLTAEWTPTQYTINYTTVDGSGSATVNFNATQSTVQLNAGTGFNNGGNILTKWQANGIDFGNPNEEISVQRLLGLLSGGNTSVTLMARWEALQTFAVTFAPGDQASAQSLPQNTTTYNGGTISLSQKPTVTGYDFKGWKVTKTDDGAEITTLSESETQYTMPGEYAITLTAQWQAIQYTVQYDANSVALTGLLPTNPTGTYTITDNVSIQIPPQPWNLANDKMWKGWALTSNSMQTLTSQALANGSVSMQTLVPHADASTNVIKLYAMWETAYTLTLNLNGGTLSETPTQYSESQLTLPTPTAPDSKFTFVGWADNTNLNGTVTAIPANTTGEKTYYAVYHTSSTSNATSNITLGNEKAIEFVAVQGGTVPLVADYMPVVSNFSMSKYEITQGQWQEVMGNNPSVASTTGNVDNNPIGNINWYDAITFCNKLSIKQGKQPCYSVNGIDDWENLQYSAIPSSAIDANWDSVICDWNANGYRLPTEAEWEYVARGGTHHSPFIYSGSDTKDDVAWNYDNASNSLHEVGTLSPNALDIYDMSGNVSEWCWDWYNSNGYDKTQKTNPTATSSANNWRSSRSGAYGLTLATLEVSYRSGAAPFSRSGSRGFRIVCRP